MLAAGLAVLAALLAPALATGESRPRQLRGVTLTPAWFYASRAETARELEAARGLGADITRITAPWALVQPHGRHPDVAFVDKLDWVLRAARNRHLRVDLGIGGGTPCWAVHEPECTVASISPPDDPRDFARYARWITRRYGRLLYGVELGNEPNHQLFFRGSAADYARMARAGLQAVKKAAPRVVVAAPALAFSDVGWMRRFYRAGGRRIGDVVSVHPYSLSFTGEAAGFRGPLDARPEAETAYGFRSGLLALRALMREAADRRPVWLTEFGYASCAARPYCADDSTAAQWMAQAFEWAARQGWIAVAMSFTLRDQATAYSGQADWDTKFGLLGQDFTLKPEALAVRDAWARLR